MRLDRGGLNRVFRRLITPLTFTRHSLTIAIHLGVGAMLYKVSALSTRAHLGRVIFYRHIQSVAIDIQPVNAN